MKIKGSLKVFLKNLLALLITISSVHLYAQDKEEKSKSISVEVLDEVVVTGSRTERTMSTSPVKTELVKKETIQRLHQNDLSQVLDNIPGITLQGLTGRLGRSAVIQGLGEDQILVMIDGIAQLQTSSSGYDLTQLSVNDIERVEVIKGGASSLYGSQAIGGVINIITKRPTDKTSIFLDIKNYEIPGEKNDSYDPIPNMINASVSGKVKDFLNYKLSFGHRRQESVDLDTSTIAEDTGRQRRYNFSGYISKKIAGKNEVYLDYRYISEDNEIVKTIAESSGYNPINNGNSSITNSFTLGYNTQVLDLISLKNYVHHSVITDVLNYDYLQSTYEDNIKTSDLNTTVVESQMDFSLLENQMTTLGMVYRYQFLNQDNVVNSSNGSIRNIEVENENITTLESYLQHSMRFNNLEFTPGFRFQTDSNFGSHTSPSVNLIYSPHIFDKTKTNIRSSIGTGYRVPSLKERFYILDHRSLGNYIVYGSENLNPETSISYQLGIEFIRTRNLTFYINGFLNNVTNMIGIVENTNESGNMAFGYQNIDEVLSRGIEISTTLTLLNKLELQQDITFSKTDSINGKYEVPLRPRTIYKLRALYKPMMDLDLIGLMRFQSDEFLDTENTQISPSYTVFDLMINYRYENNFVFYLGVENLLNETRPPAQDGIMMMADNRPAIGRQMYFGFSFTE